MFRVFRRTKANACMVILIYKYWRSAWPDRLRLRFSFFVIH